MEIASGTSTNPDSQTAIKEAYAELNKNLTKLPDLIMLYASVTYDSKILIDELKTLTPDTHICGGTSCQGVMTETGFHSVNGTGLGLFAITDSRGSYGVGAARQTGDLRAAASQAAKDALADAKRAGEIPDLVWITGAPGQEEQLLLGIEDVLGADVPIIGGSTADNTISGDWEQFAGDKIYQDAVVVGVLFPSAKTVFSFHSGYTPTQHQGVVTRASERTIYEIDNEPAAVVYNRWTDGLIEEYISEGGNILGVTSLFPLGREVGEIADVPYFKLSHPETVTAEQGITLFSNVQQGDDIVLMTGSRNSLVERAGRVTSNAQDQHDWQSEDVLGAMVVYCAGCMLTIQEDMDRVAMEIKAALGDKPFLGMFSFGEQGCFVGGENRHGNLMISSIVFGSEARSE